MRRRPWRAWSAGAVALALLAGTPARAQAPAAAGPGTPAPTDFTAEQREAIRDLLREVLRTDPSILRDALRRDPSILREALVAEPLVLRDALEALQEAEAREREGMARIAIADNAEALFRDPASPVKGNPQGAVTLVEFFDARCGYCKQMHPAMEELVRRQRDLRVVMKDLPVLGPNSVLAARALLAAQRQGRYGALQDALLRLREDTTEPVLKREAERVGLDWARLRREMDDPEIQRQLEANLRLARALRIEGTPALVVGETLVPGAVDLATLERLVAEERARVASAGPARR
jgi:protein-disulfide isomerase